MCRLAACRAAQAAAAGGAGKPAVGAEGETAVAGLPPQHAPAQACRCRQHNVGVSCLPLTCTHIPVNQADGYSLCRPSLTFSDKRDQHAYILFARCWLVAFCTSMRALPTVPCATAAES